MKTSSGSEIYEICIFELQMKESINERASQLCTQQFTESHSGQNFSSCFTVLKDLWPVIFQIYAHSIFLQVCVKVYSSGAIVLW